MRRGICKKVCQRGIRRVLRIFSMSMANAACPLCDDLPNCGMSKHSPSTWWFVRGFNDGIENALFAKKEEVADELKIKTWNASSYNSSREMP